MGWVVAHEITLSALGLFRFSILDSQSSPSPSPSRLTIIFAAINIYASIKSCLSSLFLFFISLQNWKQVNRRIVRFFGILRWTWFLIAIVSSLDSFRTWTWTRSFMNKTNRAGAFDLDWDELTSPNSRYYYWVRKFLWQTEFLTTFQLLITVSLTPVSYKAELSGLVSKALPPPA